jgi:hypothetical protein
MTETGDLPAGTTLYHCPLPECGWTLAQPPPDPFAPVPVITGESLDETIGRASMAIMREWYAETEQALEAHLGTHTLLEWMQEIDRLNRLLAKVGTPTGATVEVDRGDLAELLTKAPHEGTAWERLADRMLSTSRTSDEDRRRQQEYERYACGKPGIRL